jgi:hypothetical protein
MPKAWKVYSIALRRDFLSVNHPTILRTVVETSLHPSSAGNGRILSTQRLIERSAMIEKSIFHVTPYDTISTNPHPIHIGPESISVAS